LRNTWYSYYNNADKSLKTFNLYNATKTANAINTHNPSIHREARASLMKNAEKKYKTKEICGLFDISRATLFRWESQGLITGVERDWRGWRTYHEENVKEIERIMKKGSK